MGYSLSGQVAAKDLYYGSRVVVLGASGFIGRWVARALYVRGARVHLVVRNKNIARNILAQSMVERDIIEGDLRDTGFIGSVYSTIRPAITFNVAGYGVDRTERDASTAYQINAELVRHASEAIAGTRDPEWQGQDIVHVGTALEYGAIAGNLSEEATPCPTTLYGQTKLAGTRLLEGCCKTLNIKGLTARLFTVYGPGEHEGRLLPSLLDASRAGTRLPLTAGSQKRDFTYVENIAEALLRLGLVSAARPGEIVNVATGKLTSVKCFARSAARILGFPEDRLVFGALPTREEEMEHDELALERLKQLIAWVPPTSIEEGIRKTLDHEAHCGQVSSPTVGPSRI